MLGAPTLRLRGDYLAIVTLGFGEIVQDVLRNLETVTDGTQGINPLAYPTFFGYTFVPEVYQPWYYLFLAILALVVVLIATSSARASAGPSCRCARTSWRPPAWASTP